MKRIVAMVVVMAVGAPAAHADPGQDKWRHVFAGSVMVTAVGATMIYWGRERIDNMEAALCTGSYATDCGHAPPSTAAQVDDFNSKGQRGETIARVGLGVMLVGAAASVVSGYEGFKHTESNVVIAPTVTPAGAGASLTLRF